MEGKIIALGPMMMLSMAAVARCGRKAGIETTTQATAEGTAANTVTTDATTSTMQADVVGTETTVIAQPNDSYQYVSAGGAVAAVKDKSAHVLGVGEWDNYVRGRVADSVWYPIFPLGDDSLTDAMNVYARKNLNSGEKIYITCNSGKRGVEKATGVFKEASTDGSLIYTVRGETKALESEKGVLATSHADKNIDWKTVTAVSALKVVGRSNVQILNVHGNDTCAESHLKGSLQCPLEEIENPMAQTTMYKMAKGEMDPPKPVYLLYYSGSRYAKIDISVMKDAGFNVDNLFIIEGGTKDKDIQAAFTIEQDNPPGDVIFPNRTTQDYGRGNHKVIRQGYYF